MAEKDRCMKCKFKEVEIKNARGNIMRNDMKGMQGTCGDCGTKVFRIIGKAK